MPVVAVGLHERRRPSHYRQEAAHRVRFALHGVERLGLDRPGAVSRRIRYGTAAVGGQALGNHKARFTGRGGPKEKNRRHSSGTASGLRANSS